MFGYLHDIYFTVLRQISLYTCVFAIVPFSFIGTDESAMVFSKPKDFSIQTEGKYKRRRMKEDLHEGREVKKKGTTKAEREERNK